MVRFAPLLLRKSLLQILFARRRRGARREPDAVAYAEYVRIYRNGVAPKRYAVNDVCRFYTDPIKATELFYRGRNLTVKAR